MDDQYHYLSLRLYEILDWVGASDEMRDKYREEAIAAEIMKTTILNLSHNLKYSCYVFGSNCEGTTISGLNSDTDILCCLDIPVIERICDAPHNGQSYLMVADETTKPGYFKLQLVVNGVPSYNRAFITPELQTDEKGRICLRNVRECNELFPNINGPAVTRIGMNVGISDLDLVIAYQCQLIPGIANSWLRRLISCNRLNDTHINILKGSGSFFVGKNHPLSGNDPIEWRLSFSLQERQLMSILNSTQHKCYILLKIIKKDIISYHVPQSISSYHCKTCVLYAVEHTSRDIWTRKNLLKCTCLCIKLLLHWVKERYCPNYFLPDENMFDKLDRNTLRQVHNVLDDMVERWCTFLWSLTCNDIGKVLHDVLFGCGPRVMRTKQSNVSGQAILQYISLYGHLRSHLPYSIAAWKSNSAYNVLSKLHSVQSYLLHTECDKFHTEKETRQTIRYFIPHIRQQIAQCVASIILTTNDEDLLKMLFDTFSYYIKESRDLDVISACLIVASYCLQSHRYDSCEEILLKSKVSLKSNVISMCGCKTRTQTINLNEALKELVRMFGSQDIPYTEFTRTCTTGCLAFPPHQVNLVPTALHYEMYRPVYTSPDLRNERSDIWSDWIVVDSRVYMYFLQYVLFSKTNKALYKQDAINNLIHVINTDSNLGHKETASNLLGWIFKQEHKIQRAMECFLISWRIRPNRSAIWHALVLIHSTHRRDSDNHVM